MSKFLEFIDPYDRSSGDIFIRTEHLARYLYAAGFVGRRRLRRVLDAACGNGYGSRILARRASTVVGEDRNDALIRQGNALIAERGITNIELHASNLDRGLGIYDAGAFDCAVCFETLEHVEKDTGLLLEFHRVLRKSGYLLLSVPKAGYEPAGEDGKPYNTHHLRLYEADKLINQLEDCGFYMEELLGQPYSNIIRVRMEDYCRDTGNTCEEIGAYFSETPESLEFYARLWGWPVKECQEKSNVLFTVCKRI